MILVEGDIQFDFQGALNAFKFDEKDKESSNFHGLSHCMKAVDFVVEYPSYYVFIEVKCPPNPGHYSTDKDKNALIKSLTQKFRDSFIYRWAENKLDKPIRYQCLVEQDNALNLYLMKELRLQLPSRDPKRWSKSIVELCALANIKTWNSTFPHIQVSKTN